MYEPREENGGKKGRGGTKRVALKLSVGKEKKRKEEYNIEKQDNSLTLWPKSEIELAKV